MSSNMLWMRNRWTDEINRKDFSEEILQNIYCGNAKAIFSKSEVSIPVKSEEKISSAVNYKHSHVVPGAVLRELVNLNIEIEQQELETNVDGCSRIAMDIPEVWSLNDSDLNRIIRLYNKGLSEISSSKSGAVQRFGAVRTDDPDAALLEIDYCLNALKLEGICIYPDLEGSEPELTLAPVLVRKLAAAGVPVMVHPRSSGGYPIDNAAYLDSVYFMAKIFYSNEIAELKDVEFILTHTCGILETLGDMIGALYYMQYDKLKMGKLIFDYAVMKKPKGEIHLRKMITD